MGKDGVNLIFQPQLEFFHLVFQVSGLFHHDLQPAEELLNGLAARLRIGFEQEKKQDRKTTTIMIMVKYQT